MYQFLKVNFLVSLKEEKGKIMAYKDLIPYNNMSKWMSENGGPEKAVNLIQKNSWLHGEKAGRSKGRLEGIGIGAAFLLVGSGVNYAKKMWNKHKEKMEEDKQVEEQAEIAKDMIIATLKQKEKSISKEVKEQDEADTP